MLPAFVPTGPNAASTATLKRSAACDLTRSRAKNDAEAVDSVDSVLLDCPAAKDSSKIMLAIATVENDAHVRAWNGWKRGIDFSAPK
jgi:hypothetical protein